MNANIDLPTTVPMVEGLAALPVYRLLHFHRLARGLTLVVGKRTKLCGTNKCYTISALLEGDVA